MKLLGSRRNSRHAGKNGAKNGGSEKKAARKGGKRALKIASIVLLVVVALGTAAFAYIRAGVKPPEIKDKEQNKDKTNINTPRPSDNPGIVAPPTPTSSGDNPDIGTGRDHTKYTFVILGTDDGNGNTDVMMVATFDTTNYELHVVNIPRDTLVNVSWNTKKANSIYANTKIGKPPEEQMDGVYDKLEDILGYHLDFYVLVDLKAFAALVNAVDGVDFYVPRNMNYEDPAQNLSIHFTKGMHHLNGSEALKVVRFRLGDNNTGYGDGDIGRIKTQQEFLMSAVKQILEKKDTFKSISKLTSLADIFIKYVKTDLTLGETIWFGQEFLKIDPENVSFTTIPGNTEGSVYHGGQWVSYVTIYVDEWLELLNSKLNPFAEDFVAEDLSILTRNASKKLYVTDGNYQGNSSWGTGSPSASSGNNSNSNNNSNNTNNTPNNNSGSGAEEKPPETNNPPTEPSADPPVDSDPSINPNPGVSEPPDTSGETPPELTTPDNSGGDGSGPVVG